MPIHIRLLTPADAAELKPFRLESLRTAPDAFHSTPDEWDDPIEEFERKIAENRIFAAFEGDRMIGTAMLALTARNRAKLRHKCEIWAVYVTPDARGRGAARSLMEACIGEARALGYAAIILTVTAHNADAVRFYQSLGFTIFGTERDKLRLPDGRSIDDHLMQLDLA